MKFGKEFRIHLEETLPEWRDKFLCYKLLKKLLKHIPSTAADSLLPFSDDAAASSSDQRLPPVPPLADLQDWFVKILSEELEKFNDFYVDKEEEFVIRLQQGRELGYREVLLLSSGLAVLTLAGVISNLDMDMDPRTRSFRTKTELVPLCLVILVLLITFCPFNVIYRSSRFFLIRCAFRCFCAPLYKVTLPDFFFADQLTSQVQALRCLEFYICYYGWGDYKRRSNKCNKSDIFDVFYIIVAVIPYWVRFFQCLRRLVEERDFVHALNGLKYFSTIVAVVMRTGNDLKWGAIWKIMAAASSGVATIASTYWDVVIDWGLLRRNSRNPWLRDKLLISNKSVYFVAIVLNATLRFAWMQSVLGIYDVPFLHRTAVTAIVACLEILRRGIWNFFRLENEHLNNVGKYRAFKSVPLPFNYDHEEKDV